MYNPLSGSFAKVCTELRIPDRTRKVPQIPSVKVIIESITVQECKIDLFSKTNTQWTSAVRLNQGIKEIFSTGSQNQKPPQPSS